VDKVTIKTLRDLHKMAVLGVPVCEAARRAGRKSNWVVYWKRAHQVPFQPRQNRQMPGWLMPEAARQAANTLRHTLERIQCRG